MRMCMRKDAFADLGYGKLALKKIAPTDPNFRLYEAGWMGDRRDVMFVSGAVFREAKSGPNKGEMTVIVPGTKVTVYLTAQEVEDAK